MKTFLLCIALLLSGTPAFAGGSIEFSEVQPLLAQNPSLSARLAGINVDVVGDAVRIGRTVSPALGGTRICPYSFTGKDKNAESVDITILADVDFFDSHGKKVCHLDACNLECPIQDMQSAVSLKETLRDIVVQKDAQ